jgi:hypothetical protein
LTQFVKIAEKLNDFYFENCDCFKTESYLSELLFEFALLSWDCEISISLFRLLAFNLQVSNPYFVFVFVFSDCLCLVLNLMGCVNAPIKCEFRTFSFRFHVLMFGNTFIRGFFIVFRSPKMAFFNAHH